MATTRHRTGGHEKGKIIVTSAYSQDDAQDGVGEPEQEQPEQEQPEQQVVRKVPDLPASLADLTPKVRRLPNINDQVHSVFDRLFEDQSERGTQFRRALNATNNAGAWQGSMIADDFAASIMIKEAADRYGGYDLVEGANWTQIRLALRVVMRRWGISREERRNMLGEEIVPNGDDE